MELPRILLFVVGRVMTALVAGLGLGFNYTGESWLTVPSGNWGLIGLISFGAFILITLYREIDLAMQQRPNIVVEPRVYENRAFLEVKNNGGEASFTAKARVIATIPEQELYTMYWEPTIDTKCHIDGNGGTASILVAEKVKENLFPASHDIYTTIFKGGLALYRIGSSGIERFPAFSGKRSKKINGDTVREWGTAIARCIVEITLTATPRLRKKWGTHKYIAEVDETDGELKFYETTLSTPNKEVPWSE